LLISAPRGSVVLDGVRGSQPVDRAAVESLVRAVGDLLATYPDIAELDLNPVLADANGCIAVDARLIRR